MELLKPKIPFLSVLGTLPNECSGKEMWKDEKWQFPWYSLNCASKLRTCWAPQCIHVIPVCSWKYPPLIHSVAVECVRNTATVSVEAASWSSHCPCLSLFLIPPLLIGVSGKISPLNPSVDKDLALTPGRVWGGKGSTGSPVLHITES